MKKKIGTKLVTSFMLIILLLIALAVYTINLSWRFLRESIGKNSIFLAEEMARRIDSGIYIKIMELQANSKDLLLQRAVLKSDDYSQDDKDWWQIAREKGFYVGGVSYDESAETHALSIGVRVDDQDGNFIGIMKAAVDVKDIIREAEIDTKEYGTTEIKLFTKDGRLIYSTKAVGFPEDIPEDISERELLKNIKDKNDFFIAQAGERERLFAYANSKGYREFEGMKWILVMEYDAGELLKPIFIIRHNIVVVFLILIILVILIAFFIFHSISNPIKKLTKTVESISTEKPDVEIDPKLIESEDEIGELAASFTRIEGSLKETQEELIHSKRLAAVGQLASCLGHELRNPLGVIGNSVYYLNMKLKGADEKVRRHLDIIQREVKWSDHIIADLLDFYKARPPYLEEGDINRIVKDALADIKLPENIALETKLYENLPRILLDPSQIQRVVQNIVSNGIQAMPKGGRLEIKTGANKNFIEITFKDTGEGITKDNLQKIFEPLFTTKAKGIGLGLAIVESIVEGHNGRIEVDSVVGKGTTFTVKLPLQRGERGVNGG